jgi:hypothetical protein
MDWDDMRKTDSTSSLVIITLPSFTVTMTSGHDIKPGSP